MSRSFTLVQPGAEVLFTTGGVYFIPCRQIHRANSITGTAFNAAPLIFLASTLHLVSLAATFMQYKAAYILAEIREVKGNLP